MFTVVVVIFSVRQTGVQRESELDRKELRDSSVDISGTYKRQEIQKFDTVKKKISSE